MASPSADETASRYEDRDVAGVPEQLTHFPRRPLPVLVVALMSGICLGVYYPLAMTILIVLAALGAGAAMVFNRYSWSSWSIHFAMVMMGWILMVVNSGHGSGPELRDYMSRDHEYVEIISRVVSQSQFLPPDARGRVGLRFECEVEAIRRGESFAPLTARINVKLTDTEGLPALIRYGDRLQLRGGMRRDDRPAIQSRGMDGYMSVNRDQVTVLDTRAGNSFVAWCYGMRDSAQERLAWGVNEDNPSVALTRALLLGLRQDVPNRVYEAFARTGTLHILALSGMHVGILVLLMVVLLKSIGMYRPYWIIVFLPFLTAYAVGTGAAASMVRATIMSIVFFTSFLVRRRADAPTSLALSALLILVVDPRQLFDYGFILSFTAVGGIIALYPELTGCLRSVAARDTWSDPESGWLSSTSGWRRGLEELAGISAAAWMVTLPLIATVFHLISPIALLVNMVLVPLSSVILLTSSLAMGASLISYGLTSIFNHANILFGDCLLYLVDRTSAVPGSHVYVSAWPWYLVLFWYGLLAVWITRKGKLRMLSGACMLILIVMSIGQRSWSRDVHAVSIPNGDGCVLLIDGPGNHAVLVDSGSSYRLRDLIEHLRSRGISRLDRIILSRATGDSYGGIGGLLESVTVGEVLVPDAPSRHKTFHEHLKRWREREGPEQIAYWKAGGMLEGPGSLLIRMLFPPEGRTYEHAGNSSLILHISHGVQSVLFMGLADPGIESAAAKELIDWNADTLVVGKCDQYDSLSMDWLQMVKPSRVIYSSRSFDRLAYGPYRIEERVKSLPGTELLDLEDGAIHVQTL